MSLTGFGPLLSPALYGVASAAPPIPADLRIGFLESIDYLNPFRGLNDPSYLLYGAVYDYLFSFDQDGKFVPNLATNAVCSDASCQNWTYWIRQNVKWHDNTPFTAEDVNFSVNYNIKDIFHLWAFEPYINRVVQCDSKLGNLNRCGAIVTSPWNVTVFFDRSFAPGKSLFIPIIQKAQWQGIQPNAAQKTFDNPNPIGTGPFVADSNIYSEWQNHQPIHLLKNANYHPVGSHIGPPSVDNLYLQQFPDEPSLILALKAGAIDLAKLASGYDSLANTPNVGRQEGLLSTQYWNEIGISQYDNKSVHLNPTRFDINVRRAVAKATNKDFILQTIYNNKGVRGDTLMSPITPEWWYNASADPNLNLTYDIAAANAMLDAAGYTDRVSGISGCSAVTGGVRALATPGGITVLADNNKGQNLSYSIPQGTALVWTMATRLEFKQEQNAGNLVASMWAQIGVCLKTKPELESALSNDVYGGGVESYIWYWSGDPDPNYLLSIESGFTLDGWNDNYWNNGTYNALYVDHLAALDPTKRQDLVFRAEKLHYSSAVYIIYIYPFGQWGYRTDKWSNWGDWNAHPYRQMDAFWGANPLFFDIHYIGASADNPPTKPAITGPSAVYAGQDVSWTANSTDPDPGQTLNWTWSWDDGSASAASHPTSVTEDTQHHTYAAPGRYNITVITSDGTLSATSDRFLVIVTNPPAVHGWINGTVKDLSGIPIHPAVVAAAFASNLTLATESSADTSGHYSLLLGPDTYDLVAVAPLFLPGTKTNIAVAADATQYANFTLTPSQGWVIGKVTNAADGSAVNGAAIYATPAFGSAYAGRSNANGDFNITVAPGTYTVNASATGFYPGSMSGIVVASRVAKTVNIALTPVPGPGVSPLLIGGISIAVVIAAIAIAAVFLSRRRKKKEEKEMEVQLPPK